MNRRLTLPAIKLYENTLFVEYGFLIAGRLRPSGRGRFL